MRRKKHKTSIMQKKDGRCYLCMKLHGDDRIKTVQEHHAFGGPRRNASEAAGLKVYLCLEHHEYGPEAVHTNHDMMLLIQRDCQQKYEETHSRQQFMQLMGKNYLED